MINTQCSLLKFSALNFQFYQAGPKSPTHKQAWVQWNDDSTKNWALKGQEKRQNSPIKLVNSPWAAWATFLLYICSDIHYKAPWKTSIKQLAMMDDIDSSFSSREIIDREIDLYIRFVTTWPSRSSRKGEFSCNAAMLFHESDSILLSFCMEPNRRTHFKWVKFARWSKKN